MILKLKTKIKYFFWVWVFSGLGPLRPKPKLDMNQVLIRNPSLRPEPNKIGP